MFKLLFPEIQNLSNEYVLPSSIAELYGSLTNSELKQQHKQSYMINNANIILSSIPEDIQNYLINLSDAVNSKNLDGQLNFFKTALSLGKNYSDSKIKVWAKDLLIDEKKTSFSTNNIYDYIEFSHKQEAKYDVLEEKIMDFKNVKNIDVATNTFELEKNLISHGGLGVVIENLEFENPLINKILTLSCSISKNDLLFTDPLWNNTRYREGGDSVSNQHNYLINLFKDTSAIAVSKNSFYASDSDNLLLEDNSFIQNKFKKYVLEKGVKRRQAKTKLSNSYSKKIDAGMNSFFLDKTIMNGTFILSLY